MGARRGELGCSSEKLPGLDQGKVESFPVEADQPAEGSREGGKMAQHGLFFGEIP